MNNCSISINTIEILKINNKENRWRILFIEIGLLYIHFGIFYKYPTINEIKEIY